MGLVKIVELKVVRGKERVSGEYLKILFSGSRSDFDYITKKVFDGDFSVIARSKMPMSLFLLMARSNFYQCDFALFQYRRSSSVRLKASEYCLPLWVGTTISLPLQVKTNSAKNDIRIIRKNNLQYRVTDSLESIDDFFVNFWVPTVKKRYPEKDAKDIQKERRSWSEYRCELLMVSDGGCDVSGVLIRYDDDCPYLWRNGLKNGDLSLWKKGAIAATYYYGALYLGSKGYKELYLGLSRGFLSDGVFQYKKKWGGAVKGRDRYAFGLRVFNDSAGVRKFLTNNPVFSFYNDGLYLTVFTEGAENRDKNKYLLDGLDGVRFVDINAMSFGKKER
ncbi:MAG: hypothetical protein JW764_07485 [Chlorobiaceae bacterium]|nr:hypothetical protein [Chlorobiaceae bacterium]